jgi:hypothetical protein
MVQTNIESLKTFTKLERLILRIRYSRSQNVECIINSPEHPRRCLVNNVVYKFSYQYSKNVFRIFPASKIERRKNPAKEFTIFKRISIT